MPPRTKVDFATGLLQTRAKYGSMRALRYAAGGLRKTAQRSIRKRTRRGRPSKPGMPPKTPTLILKKWLLYAVDSQRRSAVIGPARLPRATRAPSTLEFGGEAEFPNKRRRVRKVGGAGEIRIGGKKSASTKTITGLGYKRFRVTYGKLATPALAARANRLNEQIYGPKTLKRRIAKRPFMKPALEKVIPSLPRHWSGVIR